MEIPSLKMQKLSQPVRILWLHKWRVNWFQRCQFRRVCIYYFKNKSFMQALCHSIFPHLKATVEPGSSGAVHERYGLEIFIKQTPLSFRVLTRRNDNDIWVARMNQMFQFNSCFGFKLVKAETLSHSMRTFCLWTEFQVSENHLCAIFSRVLDRI